MDVYIRDFAYEDWMLDTYLRLEMEFATVWISVACERYQMSIPLFFVHLLLSSVWILVRGRKGKRAENGTESRPLSRCGSGAAQSSA